MPFTAQEINNIANAAVEWYYARPKVEKQSIQDKPLLTAMRARAKRFPGGKEIISFRVKGDYTTTFMGFTHDDIVLYDNPANIKRGESAWKELHSGIQFTGTELKIDGISVVDTTTGEKVVRHDERELTALANLLDDKLDDMNEGSERSLNEIMWRDGTQSAKVFPGVTAFIRDVPSVGIVEGIDSGLNAWWRNRAALGLVPSASGQTVTKRLREEVRQLRRYGGRPNLVLAGSAFITGLELEVAEKGIYTQSGFANNGSTDIGMADIAMRGVGTIQYDPTLDDLGRSKYAYFIDTRHLFPMIMDGEENKLHFPARPPDQYVYYRGMTWTGCLISNKLNAHAVYSIA